MGKDSAILNPIKLILLETILKLSIITSIPQDSQRLITEDRGDRVRI